ncbi:MAG: alcohol dehydrogenase catalytic domain-containing protein [Firmicutes bacterium]|nr:alcohol dehydrogenase catalytic domain-containing protein [Bacillota bacterium]
MKAAVYYGRRDVRVQAMPEPGDPGPGELLVAVRMAGICGTDASEYVSGPHLIPQTPHPVSGQALPLILGHEFMGHVAKVGPGVSDLEPGDRVVMGAGVWCGRCRWCLEGRTNLCERYYTLGFQHHGGLAEWVKVPRAMAVRVPDRVDDANAALGQPLAVAVHAYRRAEYTGRGPVLVLGAGAIGTLWLVVALMHQLSVLVADVQGPALARARQLGAEGTINLSEESLQAGLARYGVHAVDLVVECTGRRDALTQALSVAARGGTLLLVGLQSEPASLDFHDLVVREVLVRTTNAHVCVTDLPEAVRILQERPLSDVLVDRVVSLDEFVAKGLEPLSRGEVAGKVLVQVRD